MEFTQITQTRVPGAYVEIDNSQALQGLPTDTSRILIFGQRLSTGAVLPNVPTRILSEEDADRAWGRGSYLAEMCRAALGIMRNYGEVWAIAQDDVSGGVLAAGSFKIEGTATESGTLIVWLAGSAFQVAVRTGDTAEAIQTALRNFVNAATRLPMTGVLTVATTTDATIAFTARHKGTLGNGLNIRLGYQQGERLPAGLTVTLVAMASGATDPSIAASITAIGDSVYHSFVLPYTDSTNLTALETELNSRWDAMEAFEGHGFYAITADFSTTQSLGNGRNNPHMTLLGVGKSPTPSFLCAAILAGTETLETDPARPRQTLPLIGILPPVEADRFTRSQRETLLKDGTATVTVDGNGIVRIERLVTTYQTNPQGAADISYLDIETLRTLAYIRYVVRTTIAARYPRFKLANDGTQIQAGQAIVTPRILKAEIIALFRQMSEAGLVENIDQLAKDLVVARSSTDPNRVDAMIPPDLINQFRVFAARISFRL